MTRLARTVADGVAHHVTQRGNRRQPTFFEDGDFALYRDLLGERCRRHDVAVWAWCLMPNHVHPILVPRIAQALSAAMGEAHQRYTTAINRRHGWTGHLWQGRFAAVALDAAHLIVALRYIELNPVRAGLVATPAAWPWSSARAHLTGREDRLTDTMPLLDVVGDWAAFLEVRCAAMSGPAALSAHRTSCGSWRNASAAGCGQPSRAASGKRLVVGPRREKIFNGGGCPRIPVAVPGFHVARRRW